MWLYYYNLDFILYTILVAVTCWLVKILLYKYRQINIKFKEYVIFIVVFVISVFVSLQLVTRHQQESNKEYLSSLVDTYRFLLDSNGLISVTKNLKEDDNYLKLIQLEKDILEHNDELSDIYTFKVNGNDKFVLVVDSETDYDRNGKYEGERESRTAISTAYDKLNNELINTFAGQSTFTYVPYHDEWGDWVTFLSPVFDKDKNVYAVIGLDFSAEEYIKKINFSRLYVLIVFNLLGLMIGSFIVINLLIKKEKDDLDKVHKKFIHTFQNLPMGTVIINADNTVLLNKESYNILGMDLVELIDIKKIVSILLTRNESKDENYLNEIPNGTQLEITSLKGHRKILNFYKYVSNDQKVWLLQDVTSEIENNNKFKLIFNQSTDGFALLNEIGLVLDCNNAFLSLLNKKDVTQIKFQKISDLIKVEENLSDSHNFDYFIKNYETSKKRTYSICFSNSLGEITYTSMKINKIEIGAQSAFLLIFSDLTKQKEAELEAENAKVRSMHSARMASLGEMAGGIAHEINNPLAIINGCSQLLMMRITASKLDQEYAVKQLEKIDKTTNRIAKIIKGLRSFARDGSGDNFSTVKVSDLIEETLEFCYAKMKANGIDLRINNNCPNMDVDMRQVQISQVLIVLLNNAADAIFDLKNPWIDISIAVNNEILSISVTDCGSQMKS